MKKTREEKIKLLQSKSKKENSSKWREVAIWNRKHKEALDDYIKIAARIAVTLEEKNMSQKDLADALQVAPQALSRIMKGRQNLTLQTIRKIEQVLGISLIRVLEASPRSILNKVIMVPVSIYYYNPPLLESKIIFKKQIGPDSSLSTSEKTFEISKSA